MADIEEILLDNNETDENIQDIQEEIVPEKQDIPDKETKNKKGRPPGAKNKPKPIITKPKPKPKPKVKKQPVLESVYEEDEDSYESPPAPPRRRPNEIDRNALAAEVLGILQQQRYNQTTARRSHYQSWFANM